MLLSEIVSLYESFDINNDKLPNSFGDLLKASKQFAEQFRKLIFDTNMSGETYKKICALKPLHPYAEYRENKRLLSLNTLMNEFNDNMPAILVYFKTSEETSSHDPNEEPKERLFDNDIMSNNSPIYLHVKNETHDNIMNDDFVYLFTKYSSNIEIEMRDHITVHGVAAGFQPNVDLYHRSKSEGNMPNYAQYRMWVLFK